MFTPAHLAMLESVDASADGETRAGVRRWVQEHPRRRRSQAMSARRIKSLKEALVLYKKVEIVKGKKRDLLLRALVPAARATAARLAEDALLADRLGRRAHEHHARLLLHAPRNHETWMEETDASWRHFWKNTEEWAVSSACREEREADAREADRLWGRLREALRRETETTTRLTLQLMRLIETATATSALAPSICSDQRDA